MGNNGCGDGGLLGGLFGGGGCNDSGSCKVTRFELAQSQAIATLQSEKYSDQSNLAVFERLFQLDKAQTVATNGLFRETFVALAALDKETAVNKMEIDKNFQLVNQKIDCCCQNVNFQIASLAQHVEDNYIKADKYISACHVTPYPQIANPQPTPTFVCGCGCGSNNG